MYFNVVSLFPKLFSAIEDHGVTGRAIDNGLVKLKVFNPRDYAADRHRCVDDRPYGGGPGMVGMVEPWRLAIQAAKAQLETSVGKPVKSIYLSPQGKVLNQALIQELAQESAWVLIAGRYEGLDERLIETEVDIEISIGDYVLSGGEIPAMAIIDGVARQLPGVLGHEESARQDSFQQDRLDCPHYTRPDIVDNMAVPSVLLSGDHRAIEIWRRKQALGATWLKRPDLLEKTALNEEEKQLLAQFQLEYAKENNK